MAVDPIVVFNIVGGLLVLALYSYGMVIATAAIVHRDLVRDRILIDHYSAMEGKDEEEDIEWEQFDELDDDGNVVERSFELITNTTLERRRTDKQTDKENDGEGDSED